MSIEVLELLDLLDERRRDDAIAHVQGCHDRFGSVTATVQGLLVPAAEAIGRRWQCGRWTVAQEHAASGILDDAFGLLAAVNAPTSPVGTVAVVAAEGEWHVTPSRMAAGVFREHGWSTWFLGGSTPPDDLGRTLRAAPVDVVAVSCTLPVELAGAARTIAFAAAAGHPVVAGGAAFGADGSLAAKMGARWAPDPAAGASVMAELLGEPVEREVPGLPGCAKLLDDGAREQVVSRLAVAPGEGPARSLLDELLRALGVATLCDEPRVLRDHLVWLEEYLAGRDRVFDRPAVVSRLREALSGSFEDELRVLLAAASDPAGPLARDDPSQSAPATVLVVDDDEATRHLLVTALELEGYDVVAIDDGGQALEAVATEEPDLVLLDVMMPGVDGLTVATRLREHEVHCPIVFVSARSRDDDIWQGWLAGADSYITKPFEVDHLLGEVARVLADHGSHRLRTR